MRGRQKQQISDESDHPELDFAYVVDQQSESNNPHLLDQAFILYSDEDMMSMSSHSYCSNVSVDSKASKLSHKDSRSQFQNMNHNQHSSNNILGSLANEQSSIYDIRESQCSESGRQLMHALQPLFKDKTFLRRSPRYAVYDESSDQTQNKSQPQNTLKSIKLLNHNRFEQSQMIEDQKSILNTHLQSSQILEQKYEAPTNIIQNIMPLNPTNQDLKSSRVTQNQLTDRSITCTGVGRLTRLSKKIHNQESESSYSNNSRQNTTGGSTMNDSVGNTNDYLSKQTKQYIMMTKKEKKIRKSERQKSKHNSLYKNHGYQQRFN